jgi:hypothetical protein
MDPKCVHARNETTYVSMNWPSILKWVQGGGEWDNKIKVIHFASLFMLFNKGKLMIDYEDFKPLFSFLNLKKNPKKHWSDKVDWKLLNMFTTMFW